MAEGEQVHEVHQICLDAVAAGGHKGDILTRTKDMLGNQSVARAASQEPPDRRTSHRQALTLSNLILVGRNSLAQGRGLVPPPVRTQGGTQERAYPARGTRGLASLCRGVPWTLCCCLVPGPGLFTSRRMYVLYIYIYDPRHKPPSHVFFTVYILSI